MCRYGISYIYKLVHFPGHRDSFATGFVADLVGPRLCKSFDTIVRDLEGWQITATWVPTRTTEKSLVYSIIGYTYNMMIGYGMV